MAYTASSSIGVSSSFRSGVGSPVGFIRLSYSGSMDVKSYSGESYYVNAMSGTINEKGATGVSRYEQSNLPYFPLGSGSYQQLSVRGNSYWTGYFKRDMPSTIITYYKLLAYDGATPIRWVSTTVDMSQAPKQGLTGLKVEHSWTVTT